MDAEQVWTQCIIIMIIMIMIMIIITIMSV